MNRATFFIATARSGTQWLAKTLQRYYADLLVVEHEPIGYAYRPKIFLRGEDRLDELRALPKVAEHLDTIHQILVSKSYVEVGFPCYALAPLLVREFGERLRLVHLIRNPVHASFSVATHNWYEPLRSDTLPVDVQPEPSDPGVVQRDYADRWPGLTTYEKALFYWTEVHLYALEVRASYPDLPYHTMKFEEMLTRPSELQKLATFLEIPYRREWEECVDTTVDRFRTKTPTSMDWTQIFQHQKALELAERFGYDLTSVRDQELQARYQGRGDPPIILRALEKGLRVLREPQIVRRAVRKGLRLLRGLGAR